MKSVNMKFTGYKKYIDSFDAIRNLLNGYLKDETESFVTAVNEAVLNAAEYSVRGLEKAEIEIDICVYDTDISVTVKSMTHEFDALRYRQQLWDMYYSIGDREISWGQYTADTEMSRGLWYILAACDFAVMDCRGQEISLYTQYPAKKENLITKMKLLLPRFLIKKHGVVLCKYC